MILILASKTFGYDFEGRIHNPKHNPSLPRGMRGRKYLGYWVRRNFTNYSIYTSPPEKNRDALERMGYRIVFSSFRLSRDAATADNR